MRLPVDLLETTLQREGWREGGCVGGGGGGGKVYSLTARDRVMQKGPVLEVSCVCVREFI